MENQLRQFYGNVPILQKVNIDGDDFLVCLPHWKYFKAFIYGELDPLNRWAHFWKDLHCHSSLMFDDDEVLNIHLQSFYSNTAISPLGRRKDFDTTSRSVELMIVLIPLNKDGSIDEEAFSSIPNGSIHIGGSLYIDGMVRSWNHLFENIEELLISDTVPGYELKWFKYGKVLYSAFTLCYVGSYFEFSQKWMFD